MGELDEDRHWRRFTEGLSDEARRRGGAAYADEWVVTLAPPNRQAPHLRVTRSDDGFATVEAGFAVKTMAAYIVDDQDDTHTASAVVSSIMDGRAWEYADADDAGTWLGTRFFIPLSGGSVGSDIPRDRPAVGPVARSFARRIPGWETVR